MGLSVLRMADGLVTLVDEVNEPMASWWVAFMDIQNI